jgi:hypothetical protein
MNSSSSPRALARFRFPVAASVLIASIGLLAAAALLAGPPEDPATIDVGHPTGHVHDHGNQTWPPQPPGMQNAVPLSNAASERPLTQARKTRAAARERLAVARADVRQALGTRYTEAKVIEGRDKSGAERPSRLLYFSHSQNRTVEVTVDGQRVRSVRSIQPAVYQPEITDAEAADAEGIARAHFAAGGQARVAALKAFAILAYQPSGKGFYSTRVLYISFHRNSDAPPEYVAWVDLTQRRVLRSRQEGQ